MRAVAKVALVLALASVCIACARAPARAPAREMPAATQPAPATAQAALRLDRYEAEIRAFETADRSLLPAPGGIVFVGSSSIRLWRSLAADFAGLPVLNRGFGGSTLPEVNHYLPRAVLKYRPRTIVLYAGDNDIAIGRTPQQVAADYRTFVRLVRDSLPSARIVFIGIKPSPSRWRLIDRQREANRLVREIVATDSLQTFVDVIPPMLGENGHPRPQLFVADSLHMTPAGYVVWRAQVAPHVR
jgi:lysophospholipase L1-like esterase